jgi:hypothetical protein
MKAALLVSLRAPQDGQSYIDLFLHKSGANLLLPQNSASLLKSRLNLQLDLIKLRSGGPTPFSRKVL